MKSPPAPKRLRNFCRGVLPLLLDRSDGRRILKSVCTIVATDRWVSFDRFHQTARVVFREFERAGAKAESHPIPTGRSPGSGRWTIYEESDVRSAAAEIVRPFHRRLADYRRNPWQLIQWSASTPRRGVVGELVILDSKEELDRIPAGGLAGKIVLTRRALAEPPGIRSGVTALAGKGAAGVINDEPVENLPGATPWRKFGWPGLPLEADPPRMVGFSLSEREGARLRRLARSNGPLTLRIRADIRRHAGSHEVVSGLIRGQESPDEEIWAVAHSCEPGAADNASGVAVCVEAARIISGLVAQRRLPPPRRSIRFVISHECFGIHSYLGSRAQDRGPLAAVCLDAVGVRPALCEKKLTWHGTAPMSAPFVNDLGAAILRSTLRRRNPGYRLAVRPFAYSGDNLIVDPHWGFSCPWLATEPYTGYHSSADTPAVLSTAGLSACAAATAAYLYFLAAAGTAEALEIAGWQTRRTVAALRSLDRKLPRDHARYLCEQQALSLKSLRRWVAERDRSSAESYFRDCEARVAATAAAVVGQMRPGRRFASAQARRIPWRPIPLQPCYENLTARAQKRIKGSQVPFEPTLLWADGKRSLADIATAASIAEGKPMSVERIAEFFKACEKIGFVKFIRHPRRA